MDLGFTIYATTGTSTLLREHGIKSRAIYRIAEGRPRVIDMIEEKNVGWIINTPTPAANPMMDEVKMRAHAVIRGIPITTTIDGLKASIQGLKSLKERGQMEVCSIQEYHRHAPKLNFQKSEA